MQNLNDEPAVVDNSRIECPHCGQPTFSRQQLLTLGPARSISCPECAGNVSVPWSSAGAFLGRFLLFAFLPAVAVGTLAAYVAEAPAAGGVAAMIAGVPLLILVVRSYVRNARLEKR